MAVPMARELAQYGIRVCTVAPGLFATALMGTLPEPAQASLAGALVVWAKTRWEAYKAEQPDIADTLARYAKIAIEAAGQGGLDTLLPHVSGKLGRVAYETGDASQGALSVGQSVAMADRVEPLAAIVARLEEEAERALDRLSVVTGTNVRNHAAAS